MISTAPRPQASVGLPTTRGSMLASCFIGLVQEVPSWRHIQFSPQKAGSHAKHQLLERPIAVRSFSDVQRERMMAGLWLRRPGLLETH